MDIMRYHKTLLVWTAAVDKHKLSSENSGGEEQVKKSAVVRAKLTTVKNALIEILAETKSGISLA